MNKKILEYTAIGLLGLVFVFAILGIVASPVIMCSLCIVFTAGALLCLLLAVFGTKKPKADDDLGI